MPVAYGPSLGLGHARWHIARRVTPQLSLRERFSDLGRSAFSGSFGGARVHGSFAARALLGCACRELAGLPQGPNPVRIARGTQRKHHGSRRSRRRGVWAKAVVTRSYRNATTP